jgi:hypothetical protein
MTVAKCDFFIDFGYFIAYINRMNVSKRTLTDKAQTAEGMKTLVKDYAGDLDILYMKYKGKNTPLSQLPLERFHRFVREIPYKMDEKPIEVLMRPYYAVKFRSQGIDCKKKAILMAAWAERNGLKWRFIASSRRPDKRKHHVYPQLKLSGEWVNSDATYRHYRIGENKIVTSEEII